MGKCLGGADFLGTVLPSVSMEESFRSINSARENGSR